MAFAVHLRDEFFCLKTVMAAIYIESFAENERLDLEVVADSEYPLEVAQ